MRARTKKLLSSSLDIGTKIVALLGVVTLVVGVLEYKDQGEAERAKATLALVDKWSEGPLTAFSVLDDAISKGIDGLTPEAVASLNAGEAPADSGEGTVELAILKMGARAARDPDVMNALVEVEFFFNRLAVCVEANLCSRHAAKAFFGDTVASLLATYGEAMAMRRDEGWSNFGLSTITLGATLR